MLMMLVGQDFPHSQLSVTSTDRSQSKHRSGLQCSLQPQTKHTPSILTAAWQWSTAAVTLLYSKSFLLYNRPIYFYVYIVAPAVEYFQMSSYLNHVGAHLETRGSQPFVETE